MIVDVKGGGLSVRRTPKMLSIYTGEDDSDGSEPELAGGDPRPCDHGDGVVLEESTIVSVIRETKHTIQTTQLVGRVPNEGDDGKFTALRGMTEWIGNPDGGVNSTISTSYEQGNTNDIGIDNTPVFNDPSARKETEGLGIFGLAQGTGRGSGNSDGSDLESEIVEKESPSNSKLDGTDTPKWKQIYDKHIFDMSTDEDTREEKGESGDYDKGGSGSESSYKSDSEVKVKSPKMRIPNSILNRGKILDVEEVRKEEGIVGKTGGNTWHGPVKNQYRIINKNKKRNAQTRSGTGRTKISKVKMDQTLKDAGRRLMKRPRRKEGNK